MELTEENRQLIISVLDDLNEYLSVMEKADEFKAHFVEDGSWVDFFKEYKKGGDNTSFEFAFIMHYDMWINNSLVWPLMRSLERCEDKATKEVKK